MPERLVVLGRTPPNVILPSLDIALRSTYYEGLQRDVEQISEQWGSSIPVCMRLPTQQLGCGLNQQGRGNVCLLRMKKLALYERIRPATLFAKHSSPPRLTGHNASNAPGIIGVGSVSSNWAY